MKKYIGVFVLMICIFLVSLFISSSFSSELIEKHVKESSEQLNEEGNLYRMIEGISSTTDNATDVLMINEAYSIDNTEPFYSFMSARKNYKKGLTKTELKDTTNELISFDVESVKSVPEGELPTNITYNPVNELNDFLSENVETSVEYARYWHGYLVFLRPLLILFNIVEIRRMLFVIFLSLLVWLTYLLKKQFNTNVAVIFAYSLISVGYFFESYSLQGAPVFLVMMISSIVLLKNIDRIKNINLLMFIIGCVTNFVDYLTVPIITLCIPLIIYMLYKQKQTGNLDNKTSIKIIITASIAWCIGYAGTWLAKWIIYDLLYDSNLIQSALKQVIYRSNGESKYCGVPFDQAMIYFLTKILLYTSVFVLYLYFRNSILIARKNSTKTEKANINLATAVIGLYPFIWYLILQNHSARHLFFSYRNILVSVIIILLCLEDMLMRLKMKKRVNDENDKVLTKVNSKSLKVRKSRVK